MIDSKVGTGTVVEWAEKTLRSTSEISSYFFGFTPWHTEIRHRVKIHPQLKLFGFETLKLKIRKLKLWKPTINTSHSVCFDLANLTKHHEVFSASMKSGIQPIFQH